VATWTIARRGPHVSRLTVEFADARDVFYVLLTSDWHWDSVDCDRALLRRDLDEAKKRGAPVLCFGDLYDCMQGRYDPRSSKGELRPELLCGNYFDAVTEQADEFLAPYAGQLALTSPGNHEVEVKKRHEISLVDRLAALLRRRGSPVVVGEYWGYVQILCKLRRHDYLTDLHYHHGYGGGGEVTRGLIDNSRTRGQYDADVYVTGHIHRRNADENVVTRATRVGGLERRRQWFLRCGSYKAEYAGWHAEKGRAARPLGGWWLEFRPVHQRKASGASHGYAYDVRALAT